LRTGLAESRYSSRAKNSEEFSKHFTRVCDMVKCVETDNTIYGFVGELDSVAVEAEKTRFGNGSVDGRMLSK
jgi:hypothetical protein